MNTQLNYAMVQPRSAGDDSPANERDSLPRCQRGAADCATRTRSRVRGPSPEGRTALEVERAIGDAG